MCTLFKWSAINTHTRVNHGECEISVYTEQEKLWRRHRMGCNMQILWFSLTRCKTNLSMVTTLLSEAVANEQECVSCSSSLLQGVHARQKTRGHVISHANCILLGWGKFRLPPIGLNSKNMDHMRRYHKRTRFMVRLVTFMRRFTERFCWANKCSMGIQLISRPSYTEASLNG